MKAGLKFRFKGGFFLIDVIQSNGKACVKGYHKKEINRNKIFHAKHIALRGFLDARWLSWPSATIAVEEIGGRYEVELACPPQSANAVEVSHHVKGREFTVARQIVRAVVDPEGEVTLRARLTEQKNDPNVTHEIREIEARLSFVGGFRIALSLRLYEKAKDYKEEIPRASWNDLLLLEETRATGFKVVGRLKQAAADLFDFALIGRDPRLGGCAFVSIRKRLEGSWEASSIRDASAFLKFLLRKDKSSGTTFHHDGERRSEW